MGKIIFPPDVSAQIEANTIRFYELIDNWLDDKIDEKEMLALVDKGICVTAMKEYTHDTPLMGALSRKLEKTASRLIEKHADVNARQSNNGDTVLDQATLHHLGDERRRMITMLVNAGADTSVSSKEFTKLHFAVAAGDQALCTRLIAEGANLEARDLTNRTPLETAINAHDEPMCELLIRGGADVFSRHVLHSAATNGLTRICEIILDKGENVNRPKKAAEVGLVEVPDTALMAAGSYGHADTCVMLLRRGANMDVQDRAGRTTLHRSLMSAHYSVSKLLMESGANMTLRDNEQNTIMHGAATGNWKDSGEALELLDIMRAKKLDIEAQNKNGETPLHIAGGFAPSVFADALIARGANVKARDKQLRTPLHNAASSFRFKVTSRAIAPLLAHGAEIEAVDKDGNTSMHLAVKSNNIQTIQELLAHNANIEARNNDLKTPLFYYQSEHSNNMDVYEALVGRGANVYAQDNTGTTILQNASEQILANIALMDKQYHQFVDKRTPPESAKDVYKLLAVYPLADPQADIDQYAHLRQIFSHVRWKSPAQAGAVIKQLKEDNAIDAATAETLQNIVPQVPVVKGKPR